MEETIRIMENNKPDSEKPSMFLRKGAKGGLYFFSPKKSNIYYMSRKHVEELLSGKRDFAVIHKGTKNKGIDTTNIPESHEG